MIGYAFCGSFCTHQKSLEQLRKLRELGYDILPIMSENVKNTDTRFGTANEFVKQVETITGHSVVSSIVEAETLGPKVVLDALVICPCTGNTLSKLAQGISDNTVTLAVKAHLRSDRTTVICLCSNDALSANLKNISTLLERKNIFFVPMKQDDPVRKPHSLVADFSKLQTTLELAKEGKQIQPIFE